MNRFVAAAVVAGVVFMAPSAALACSGGGPSAVNVYKECLPSGGGGQPSGGGNGTGAGSTSAISSQAAKALEHAGKDRRVLSALIQGSGPSRLLQPAGSTGGASAPSALGSAFDLGSGPTAILIVLASTAALLLAAVGVRGWRRSHRT